MGLGTGEAGLGVPLVRLQALRGAVHACDVGRPDHAPSAVPALREENDDVGARGVMNIMMPGSTMIRCPSPGGTCKGNRARYRLPCEARTDVMKHPWIVQATKQFVQICPPSRVHVDIGQGTLAIWR